MVSALVSPEPRLPGSQPSSSRRRPAPTAPTETPGSGGHRRACTYRWRVTPTPEPVATPGTPLAASGAAGAAVPLVLGSPVADPARHLDAGGRPRLSRLPANRQHDRRGRGGRRGRHPVGDPLARRGRSRRPAAAAADPAGHPVAARAERRDRSRSWWRPTTRASRPSSWWRSCSAPPTPRTCPRARRWSPTWSSATWWSTRSPSAPRR